MSELQAVVPVEQTILHHNGSAAHVWQGVSFEYGTWLGPMEGAGFVEVRLVCERTRGRGPDGRGRVGRERTVG